jgi:hypothetical protein
MVSPVPSVMVFVPVADRVDNSAATPPVKFNVLLLPMLKVDVLAALALVVCIPASDNVVPVKLKLISWVLDPPLRKLVVRAKLPLKVSVVIDAVNVQILSLFAVDVVVAKRSFAFMVPVPARVAVNILEVVKVISPVTVKVTPFTVNEGDVPPIEPIVIDAILFAGVTVITGSLVIVPETTPIRTISPAALPGKLIV